MSSGSPCRGSSREREMAFRWGEVFMAWASISASCQSGELLRRSSLIHPKQCRDLIPQCLIGGGTDEQEGFAISSKLTATQRDRRSRH